MGACSLCGSKLIDLRGDSPVAEEKYLRIYALGNHGAVGQETLHRDSARLPECTPQSPPAKHAAAPAPVGSGLSSSLCPESVRNPRDDACDDSRDKLLPGSFGTKVAVANTSKIISVRTNTNLILDRADIPLKLPLRLATSCVALRDIAAANDMAWFAF